MKILNLGCGTKTSDRPEVVNIDWSAYLRIKNNVFFKTAAPLLLSAERMKKLNSLGNNVLVHNLANGIPFENDSIDVVYHSHLFEHLDKPVAFGFLIEIKRVLKKGGILRISVPDMEFLTRQYLEHVDLCHQNPNAMGDHDQFLEPLIEQSVRREAAGAAHQKPLIRWLDNFLFGDARKRGETHQWMYDQFNLSFLLKQAGFNNIVVQQYNTSLVANWNEYGLEVNEKLEEYKTESLYIEAVK